MDLSLTCKEWHCPCGFWGDTREAVERHVETAHPSQPDFWLIELHLELSISGTSPAADATASVVGITGPYTIKRYGARIGATDLALVSERRCMDSLSETEAVVFRYPPYDAMVTFGGCGWLLDDGRTPELDREARMIRGMLDRAMIGLNISGTGPGTRSVLIQSYTIPLAVLWRILRQVPRQIRQMQRGGRPEGAVSPETWALYGRIRSAHDFGELTNEDLANQFGVSLSTVQLALRKTAKPNAGSVT